MFGEQGGDRNPILQAEFRLEQKNFANAVQNRRDRTQQKTPLLLAGPLFTALLIA
jgi:hypothetical protein